MSVLISMIKKEKNKIANSEFTKSILYIVGGTATAQILNILFSPIITRLYLPEQYGILAIFTSIIIVLSSSTLKYEMAIPIPEEDKDAINLIALSFFILLIFTLSLTVVLFIWGDMFLSFFDANSLGQYKYFISLGIFFVGAYEILIKWNYRRKDFKLISKTKVAQNFLGNTFKVVFGYLGFGVIGLLLGKIIRESMSILILIKQMLKKEKKNLKLISYRGMLFNFIKYKDFAIYQTPGTFISRFRNQLPIFNIALYGSSAVGLFGLANTIVKLPMNVIGHSVRNVFFAEAASIGKKNPAKLKKLSNKIIIKLVLVGFIPTIILILIGPWLFSLIFGKDWYIAGIYARILSISIYSDFVFSPVSRVFEVIERQKEKMMLDLLGLCIVFLAFAMAKYLSNSAYLAIGLYSVVMSIFHFATFLLARFYVDKEISLIENNI